jgi:zona occludens toxin (predicted ATPase)
MNEDSRDAQRHRTLKGGRIVVNDGFSTFDCTIRNLSETGAKLEVTSSLPIPQRFELAMHDGRRFACEVAWRTETEIGVRFVS